MANRISKAPEERRRELIEVATKLFESRGYEKVSVRELMVLRGCFIITLSLKKIYF